MILLGLILGLLYWRTNDPSKPFLEIDTARFLAFITSPGSSAMARFSINEILTNRLARFFNYLWREYYLLVFGGILGFYTIRDKVLRRFILIGLLSTFVVAMVRYAREYDTYFLPFYVFFIILVGYGLDWIAKRLPEPQHLAIIALIIPIIMVSVNYHKVDHHDRTLWARITEKILVTIDRDALILSPNYDNTAFFWYYLIGEDYESKNLFVKQIDYQRLDRVKGYISGEEELYLGEQRKSAPPGLRVFTMKGPARELEKVGLEILDKNSKYVFEVRLPDSGK
ncbi:MAG: hypothetical protein ACK2TW_09025 [Anaerolineales bacterium]